MQVKKVTDRDFCKYGKVVEGIDFTEFYQEIDKIACPKDVEYVASYQPMEDRKYRDDVRDMYFGECSVEVGYCVGHNHRLNALEYHRSSEINIAAMDMILLLGTMSDIDENYQYDTKNIEAFFVPAGTAVELYATTLHFAPCGLKENDYAFKIGVILPYGTNFNTHKVHGERNREDALYYAKNKWLMAHPDGGQEGAYIGLVGENLSIKE